MKVCLFTENFHKGGLDTFLVNLINAWPSIEDQLFISCNGNHPGIVTIKRKIRRTTSFLFYSRIFTSSLSKGISDHHFIIRTPLRVLLVLAYRILQYPVLCPWYIFSLYVFFKKFSFDRLIVVNGGYPASLLCRCAVISWAIYKPKHKAIFNFHNSLGKFKWWNFFFESLLDYMVLKSSKKIISVSCDAANSIRNKWAFKNSNNIGWIYNGIEDPLKNSFSQQSQVVRNTKFILMLATYEKRKGHIFLINAFNLLVEKYPNLTLIIHGYGSIEEKKVIQNYVEKKSLTEKIFCCDFLENPNNLIALAEILVVPSQEYESFGLTIIEAMALSTPIIATNVGGIPEVLADSGAGVMVEPTNIRDFYLQMRKILDNEDYAAQMGRNGRKVFLNKFTAKRMAAQYYEIL